MLFSQGGFSMKKFKFLISVFLIFLLCAFLPVQADQIKVLKVQPNQRMPFLTTAGCLASKLALASGANQWYAQANLTVTNNCTINQNLQNAVASFQSNSTNLTTMWGNGTSAPFVFKNNVASTVLLPQNSILAPGKKTVFYFGINLSGTAFDLTSANNTLNVISSTPTPSNGEIDITVDPTGTSGVTGSSEIDITGPGLTQPYVILNSNWNTPTTYKVLNLAYGTYTINALAVGSLYTAAATPATVSVSSATPIISTVTYKPAPAMGSLQLTLGAIPIAGLASSVTGTITDNTVGLTQNATVSWSSSTTIPNLIAGHTYSVTFPEVSNGISFSDPIAIPNPVITANQTTSVNVSYQPAQSMPTQAVTFNISGLPTSTQGTLTIIDGFKNSFVQTGLLNGTVTQSLPLNDIFSVTASASNLNVTVTPSSFTLKSGTPAPAVTVQFSITPPPPATTTNFFAFADSGMQSSGTGLVPPKGANLVEAFILYTGGKADLWAITEGDPFSQKIKSTPNTFASVGGANGPYVWDYETVAKAVPELEALVDYYGFVGLDWDVEGAALETPAVQQWVTQAVTQIRKDRPNLILTLTVPDPVAEYGGFTTGTMVILKATLQANNNKMVFNWVNKMDFDENGLNVGCTQTDTNMSTNCLVQSAIAGAKALATLLNITPQQAYQYLGEIFMVPSDDQGNALSLTLANQVATTLKGYGLTHMGYWSLQRDTNLTYGSMFTHVLGLS